MQVTDTTGASAVQFYRELEDELQIFALLTRDCLALSRAMREKSGADPRAEDQLELLRRRRLTREIESALGDGRVPQTETSSTG